MMDENSAGCASEAAVTANQLADALDCFWNASLSAHQDASYHGDSPQALLSGIVQGIAAVAERLRSPAPTISQDVPAPAAVTADARTALEAHAAIYAQDGWKDGRYIEARVTIGSVRAARRALAALSAATPLQSDLKAGNARLRKAVKATEYKYFGDYEMSDDQRAAVDTLVEFASRHLARAALQGADNHE